MGKREEKIIGKAIASDTAETAGEAAIADAEPMEHNGYMVQIAKTLIKRTLLACD